MPEVPREDAYNSVHRGPGGYQENSQTPQSMELESKTPATANAPPNNIEPHLDYSDSQLPPPARHRLRLR